MATTSLWKIQNRIDKVINYTTNPEKTENIEMYKALHNTIEYATSNYKTEKQYYVTGINCSTTDSVQDMLQTKKHFGKEKGIVAYHGFQSFTEGEVTAKQAHEIGVRLAEELWGDKYEVLVSTHLTTKHYHNHFVVNSVSYVDGKKYRNTRENYAMMRKISDELCKEYGLSVIEEKPCGKHNIDYTKYYNSYIQKSDYYTTTKDDVDFAIAQAYSYKNFESILKKMGYTITIRANKISLVRPPYKRNIRIERSFGDEYSINNITERIMNTETTRIPFPEKHREIKTYTSKTRPKVFTIDRGSLYRLYLYYCYMLKVFPKSIKTRYKLTPEQRAESKKLDEFSDDMRFLCRNKIKTTKELFSYKNLVNDELKNQISQRNTLRRKRQKENVPEIRQTLCEQILETSNKIKYLKQEVVCIERIENQTQKIKQEIQEMEKQQNQEKTKTKGEIEK